MHDLISRDIRKFIRDHGRYRFGKLYELIQKNEDLDYISGLLELDKENILHWKTIFEMLGSDGIPSFVPDLPDPSYTAPVFELICNDEDLQPPSLSEKSPSDIRRFFRLY